MLVQNSGNVVSKDDLMKRVWPDTFVEEGNLTQNISLLRKALGETPGGGCSLLRRCRDRLSLRGGDQRAVESRSENFDRDPALEVPAAVVAAPPWRKVAGLRRSCLPRDS